MSGSKDTIFCYCSKGKTVVMTCVSVETSISRPWVAFRLVHPLTYQGPLIPAEQNQRHLVTVSRHITFTVNLKPLHCNGFETQQKQIFLKLIFVFFDYIEILTFLYLAVTTVVLP